MNKIKSSKRIFNVMACLSLSILTCCGGGGITGTVIGMEIAEQVSLVNATDSEASPNISTLTVDTSKCTNECLEDEEDVEIFVYDEASKSMDMVNEILCYIGQLQHSSFVNAGTYLALVDDSVCEGRRADHSESNDNQSEAQSTRDFSRWIVNSTRESTNSIQIVKSWIEFDEQGGGEDWDLIKARLAITSPKSETNPFGVFRLDLEGIDESTGDTKLTGAIRASSTSDGATHVEFVMDGTYISSKINGILDVNNNTGLAFGTQNGFSGEDGLVETTIGVAYDNDVYLAYFGDESGEDGYESCLDRNNFRKVVWDYNLYDADGNRVDDINSGFPIKYGEDVYGWFGYYGLWLPEDEVTVTNGLEVTNQDGDQTYTVFQAPGRLIKRTRQQLTLSQFTNVDLYYWDPDTGTNFIVQWNGTHLKKVGTETCDEDGCQMTPINPPLTITPTAHEFFGFWRPGSGPLNVIAASDGSISNSQPIIIFNEEYVSPDDALFNSGTVTLQCVYDCLKPNLTGDDLNDGTPYLDEAVGTPYNYTISGDDFDLKYTGTSVSLPESETVDEFAFYSWGVNTGPMVLASVDLTGQFYTIWDQPVTYRWETGPNFYNKYITLVDSLGNYVEVDPPLDCQVEVEDYGVLRLDYHGPRQLFGLPWEKIESENEESSFEHWVPTLTLEDGTELDCGGTTYYTKAMTIEQFMLETDSDNCSHIDLEAEALDLGHTNLTAQDPNIGDKPTVAEKPKVIGGEIQ